MERVVLTRAPALLQSAPESVHVPFAGGEDMADHAGAALGLSPVGSGVTGKATMRPPRPGPASRVQQLRIIWM